ncbi:c-type cytochrome [Rhodanobacter sp. 7MK24]|uniref:c-type cytochrome n=1 Tax=Rhodanobacter sp. 7MK24 TaxID=2775922 RepID=UPI00177DB73C|nr:c-type cytochrome [Rhodanobacter sp. 7MK24]MBD8880845.1 c-type cytochrome [Rhodanobacter sp. 7MK24]
MSAIARSVAAAAALFLAGAVAYVSSTRAEVSNATPRTEAAVASTPSPQVPSDSKRSAFIPPPLSAMPKDDFGKMVRLGEQIFEDPAHHASAYVGNDLRCSNCHLDAGRLANSAPMWGAYVSYPAYRSKNGHVNTFEERLQGCFRFSMNGKAPPLGDKVLVALESYSYWMSRGARVDPDIAGRGYPKLDKPPMPADYKRGQQVYDENCALCHGAHGTGRQANDGSPGFPALWGPDSFNWGAGMGSFENAAAFIRANMPLGLAGSLSVQDAWDVATFMDSQERPQDPRFTGSVAETRQRFHNSSNSAYGTVVNGHLLGSDSITSGGHPRATETSSRP